MTPAGTEPTRDAVTYWNVSDEDALLVGTGRRTPTDTEKARLGDLAARLPLVLG